MRLSNHGAAVQCKNHRDTGQELLNIQLNIRRGNKCDHTLTVAWFLVSEGHKQLISWDFHTQQPLEFTPSGVKGKKSSQ